MNFSYGQKQEAIDAEERAFKKALVDLAAAGAFVGIASGNSYTNIDTTPVTPACYGKDIPGVMTVMGELISA